MVNTNLSKNISSTLATHLGLMQIPGFGVRGYSLLFDFRLMTASLHLSFLVLKMGMIVVPTSQGCYGACGILI